MDQYSTRQYPSRAFQVLGAPTVEPFTISPWYTQWVDPQKNWKGAIMAAAMVAALAGPITPPLPAETASVSSFVQPLEVPQRKWAQARLDKIRLAPSTFAPPFPAIVASVGGFFQPFSTPQVKRFNAALHESYFSAQVSAEDITLDKWYVQFTDPLKSKPLINQQFLSYIGADPFPESISEDRWHQPFSEPVRTKLRTIEFSAFTYGGPPIFNSPDQWWQPFSEPVRLKQRATDFPAFSYDYFVTPPPPPTPGDNSALAFTTVFSQIYPGKTIIYQGVAYAPFTPTPEDITVDKWYDPLSEPSVKAKPRAANFPFLAIAPTQPTASDGIGWFAPFSDPTRLKPRATEFPAFTFGYVFAAPETITLDKWFREFSQPYPAKRYVAQQQFLAYVGADPFPERVSIDRWLRPLSEPVRIKPRAVDFPAFTYGPTPIVNTADQWWRPFSEPVRAKPRGTDFPAFTYGRPPVVSGPEAWWRDLSTPPKAKARAVDFPAFSMGWVTVPSAEIVTVDKWFEPLSEPKVKSKLKAAEYPQPAFAGFPIPPVTGLLVGGDVTVTLLNQRFYQAFAVAPPQESITLDKWFQWFSQPYLKRLFGAHEQRFLAYTQVDFSSPQVTKTRGYIIC